MLDAIPDPATLAVRQIMLGGEALSGALCARIRAVLPGVTLVNVYGPTETCIEATAHIVPLDASEPIQPIGRPLGNYRVYVLDARLRPLPTGVPGQLYIAGAGLAQGYLGQPGLTAAKFIADPFSRIGERLYDTGDRALWRPDGTLAYLGRADSTNKNPRPAGRARRDRGRLAQPPGHRARRGDRARRPPGRLSRQHRRRSPRPSCAPIWPPACRPT